MHTKNRFACLVPCYNEFTRLDICSFTSAAQSNPDIDFYFLNDGSTDNTLIAFECMKQSHANIFYFDYTVNHGKAEVIRKSMMNLSDESYSHIGFLDADLATPISEYLRLLEVAKNQVELDIIIASRVKLKGKNIKRNATRHWFSRIVLTVIDSIFRLEIYDTQCGCKIFKTEHLGLIFDRPFVTKWLFDIEILIRYTRVLSDTNILEMPLQEWTEVKGSKIKFIDFFLVPWNIFQLYRIYGRGVKSVK